MKKPPYNKHSLFLSGFLLVILAAQFSCGIASRMNVSSQRQLWRASGTVNYRMKIYINKTGHATPNGRFIITVRDGKTESVKREDNQEINFDNQRFWQYDTIDDIFDFIEGGTRNAPYKFEIEYDAKLGYPKKLDLDPEQRTFDDELRFEVLEFEVL